MTQELGAPLGFFPFLPSQPKDIVTSTKLSSQTSRGRRLLCKVTLLASCGLQEAVLGSFPREDPLTYYTGLPQDSRCISNYKRYAVVWGLLVHLFHGVTLEMGISFESPSLQHTEGIFVWTRVGISHQISIRSHGIWDVPPGSLSCWVGPIIRKEGAQRIWLVYPSPHLRTQLSLCP
jgi:hypothetical protein